MNDSGEIARRLEDHYGVRDWDLYRNGWSGLVRFVLEQSLSKSKFNRAWKELAETWILSSEDTSKSRRDELEEFLTPFDVSASTIALIHKLSKWWESSNPRDRNWSQTNLEDLAESEPELLAVGPTWAARVMSVILGARVVALSTGSWRVGARHGWHLWNDDPQQAIEAYLTISDESSVEPGQVTLWLNDLGSEFCGPKAKCSGCPLLPLLGPDGPIEPEC